jgi:addiction module RelE/StbE family toxin
MNFDYSPSYKKKYKKLSNKIKNKIFERIQVFENDEFDPILKNHKLHGQFDDYRSINITSDIRLIYRKLANNNYLLFEIGTHSQLYS